MSHPAQRSTVHAADRAAPSIREGSRRIDALTAAQERRQAKERAYSAERRKQHTSGETI